jgi:cyanophycin synthetase
MSAASDFLSTNIAEKATARSGGGICEVNAAPGFRMHVAPSEGTPRRRRSTRDRHAVPARVRHRACRIAAVTGTNGKTTTSTHARAHHDQMAGYTPGLTTTDGRLYRRPAHGAGRHDAGPVSAQMVLSDPQIDIAVLETARCGLLRAGHGGSGGQRRPRF